MGEKEVIEGFMGIEYLNEDFYKLLFRFFMNLIVVMVIVRYIYYRKTQRKDYLFTYFMISGITFVICFALKKLDIDVGMGLGLFAIFGIIRYRTSTVPIKEMTYLFIVIGVSVVNSLSGRQVSWAELFFINLGIVGLIYGLEYLWLVREESAKTIVYEKIELVKPENHDKLKADLEERTGLTITKIQIGKIDFLRDTAQVKIYFQQDEQDEYYSIDRGDY